LVVPSEGPAFAIGVAILPWRSARRIPVLKPAALSSAALSSAALSSAALSSAVLSSAIIAAAPLEGLASGRNKLCDALGGGCSRGIAFRGDDLRVDIIGDGLGYRREDGKLAWNIHVRLSVDHESFNLTRSKQGSNDFANARA
jgi:hypothetical protein